MLFEKPDAGRLTVFGQNAENLGGAALRDYRSRVQMVFQDPFKSLNPRRRIGQSLIEGPVENGVPKADAIERAHALPDRVGLAREAMDRFPHEFSGGQRQRICIARALAMRPRIVVADEAVSVQAQVLQLFESLRDEFGFSMLFITHDLRVASNICDCVLVMHRGRVVESGTTRDVFTSPRSDYTVELIRAIPGGMNAWSRGRDGAGRAQGLRGAFAGPRRLRLEPHSRYRIAVNRSGLKALMASGVMAVSTRSLTIRPVSAASVRPT
jgi:peptide/nickel transport system ATP-binding protein